MTGRKGMLRPPKVPLADRIELRRAFKQHNRYGDKMTFYQTHAQRLGVHWNTIRTVVLG